MDQVVFDWRLFYKIKQSLYNELKDELYKKATYQAMLQQGLEIHGLEECGPWRYTVFNWFPKHLRYTVLD